MISAIPGVELVDVEGVRLRAVVRDPSVTVPAIVAALVGAGAEVSEVVPERSTLEAAYLACIREPE